MRATLLPRAEIRELRSLGITPVGFKLSWNMRATLSSIRVIGIITLRVIGIITLRVIGIITLRVIHSIAVGDSNC